MTYTRELTASPNGPTDLRMTGIVDFEVVLQRRKDILVELSTEDRGDSDNAQCINKSTLERTRDAYTLKVESPLYGFSPFSYQRFDNVVQRGYSSGGRSHITAVIFLPENSFLSLVSHGGSLTVTGNAGKIETELHGGSVHFQNASQIDIETHGGSVRGDYVGGRADVRGGGGDIVLEEIRGEMQLKTSGGNIKVGTAYGNGFMRTSGGNLRIREFYGQRLEMHTSGGDITYPPHVGISARTSGGRINGRSTW